MAVFGVLARFVVYAVVLGGCTAALVGLFTAKTKMEDISSSAECLLFGSKSGARGAPGWCRYLEFSAITQIILAVSLGVFLAIRMVRSRVNT